MGSEMCIRDRYDGSACAVSCVSFSSIGAVLHSNAAISRGVCGGGLCAIMRACEHAHKSTPRTPSAAWLC